MRGRDVVWLAATARLLIGRESCRHRLHETGGPLFGYEAEDGSVVVEVARGPGPRARHGRFHLKPDRQAVAEAIEREIATSHGRRYLVGEWHSHPLGRARASSRDRRSVQGMSEDEEVGLTRPVALIQATSPWGKRVRPGELAAWCWEPEHGVVAQRPVTMFSAATRRRSS